MMVDRGSPDLWSTSAIHLSPCREPKPYAQQPATSDIWHRTSCCSSKLSTLARKITGTSAMRYLAWDPVRNPPFVDGWTCCIQDMPGFKSFNPADRRPGC
jgi:hypothetical protein